MSATRIGLLGFGTVGAAVHRLLAGAAPAIERVTGGPVEVAAALVRDPARHPDAPEGLLTTDFARLRDDGSISVVAEVMGGIDPTRDYVLALLRAGKSVVSANKQLVARHGEELFGEAERRGVQLRFEASVCAAIPVIKVLRESMIVSGVHRVDGIVNGTTNFILSRMIQAGATYADALTEAQNLGYAEADPTEDVTGADAAAKIAILASIAFHTRVRLEEVEYAGIDRLDLADVQHAADLGYSTKLIASALQAGGAVVARVHPSLLPRDHPLAAVEGAFNAVMLRGESIREVILEGPGAGGKETATAVIGDLLAVIGTQGTGFLQHDGYFRALDRLPVQDLESPFYIRFHVDDEPGVLAQVAQALADAGASVAQVVQHSADGVHIVILTHRAREGAVRGAAAAVAALAFSRSEPVVLPVLERAG
ncbi:MAG TPA: homoserine dehydrogenase [Gaiellales bacterium]|jgi:homoserine dehydrogenase|nr:homoserine dehydrogenase [Gaiellales bacterium]